MLSYRHGLSKLVNSLSWGKRIVAPHTVDAERTILRIDLRDYQWNEKTWDAILVAFFTTRRRLKHAPIGRAADSLYAALAGSPGSEY
jgi:hypothetical protein